MSVHRASSKVCVFTAATVTLFAPAALRAQAVANRVQVVTSCQTGTSVPPPIGSEVTLSSSSTCPTSLGALGSTLSSSAYVLAMGGVTHVINSADSEIVAAATGATAQGVADFSYPMNDIVFTSIANPSAVGPVTASLNFVVRLRASISGPADPLQSTMPQSFNSLRAILGSSTAAGAYTVRPSGPVTSGFLVGYANDFSPLLATTPSQTFTLTQPVTVQFIAQCYQTVLYNGVGPFPRVGASDTDVQISFPCGTPVFNLPPGITANSASLGIVNNLWMHPSCGGPDPCTAIDFNSDGSVNPDDLGDLINCFFASPPCPQADFNGDGDINPDDLGDYINGFFGLGC